MIAGFGAYVVVIRSCDELQRRHLRQSVAQVLARDALDAEVDKDGRAVLLAGLLDRKNLCRDGHAQTHFLPRLPVPSLQRLWSVALLLE